MPPATTSSDDVALPLRATSQLARAGFLIAFAGGLTLVAPLAPALTQFTALIAAGHASPTGGFIFLAVCCVFVFIIVPASQAFRRQTRNAAAGVCLFLGLLVFVPDVVGLARAVFSPGYTVTYQSGEPVNHPLPVPHWGAITNPGAMLVFAGLLLIVVGNAIAMLGGIHDNHTYVHLYDQPPA